MTHSTSCICEAAPEQSDARCEHVRAPRTRDTGESRACSHTHTGVGEEAHEAKGMAEGVREEAAASEQSRGVTRGARRNVSRCRGVHEQQPADCSHIHTPTLSRQPEEEAKVEQGNCFSFPSDSQRRLAGRGCLRCMLRVGELVAVMTVFGCAQLDVVEGQATAISSLKPMNGPPTGGFTLTVTGVNLASGDFSFGIRVGGSSCESTTWTR